MNLTINHVWRYAKDYFAISFGLVMYVLGWGIFLLPNNLVGGGVSGMSAIIQYATGFPMGYSYFIINVILLAIGMKILGGGFGFKTIYAILLCSFLLKVIPPMIPVEFIEDFAISNSKMLCTIIGGIFSGVGIGMAITVGGCTGGTDIIALVVCKFKQVSPGRLILAMDVAIVLSSMILPSYDANGELVGFSEKLAVCIYGLLMITVSGYSIDLFLAGAQQSVQIFIFSKKHEEIADAITYELKRGVTVIPAKGWYTKSDVNVVMVVARKTDLTPLLRYIKGIDSDAFISIGNTMGVYGKGFDTIKVKAKTKELSK